MDNERFDSGRRYLENERISSRVLVGLEFEVRTLLV
jgi:hypothetical protein